MRAPRNSPGKARALLTLLPSAAKEAPASMARSGAISGLGLESASTTDPLRTISGLIRPAQPVVAMTTCAFFITSSRVSASPPAAASRLQAASLRSVPMTFLTPKESNSLLIPIPAAPSPITPTTDFCSMIPEKRVALSSAAKTTTAVPC